MISLKALLALVLILRPGISAQESYTNTNTIPRDTALSPIKPCASADCTSVTDGIFITPELSGSHSSIPDHHGSGGTVSAQNPTVTRVTRLAAQMKKRSNYPDLDDFFDNDPSSSKPKKKKGIPKVVLVLFPVIIFFVICGGLLCFATVRGRRMEEERQRHETAQINLEAQLVQIRQPPRVVLREQHGDRDRVSEMADVPPPPYSLDPPR